MGNETSEQARVNVGCRATIHEQEQPYGSIQAAMVLGLVVEIPREEKNLISLNVRTEKNRFVR